MKHGGGRESRKRTVLAASGALEDGVDGSEQSSLLPSHSNGSLKANRPEKQPRGPFLGAGTSSRTPGFSG
jgi:hypothetical protein